MKLRLLLTLLACVATARAFEPERIVTVTTRELPQVQAMLDQGWTVKAQSSALNDGGESASPIHVFTLVPPSESLRAAARQRKAEEFQKRREEYLRKQAAAPVEK